MNILIVGAGDVGFRLSRRLSRERHNITMIEQDPQKAIRAREQLDAFVIEGSGASFQTLGQARLETVDILAAMTDNDEANLMACKLAKKAGVGTTIARVRDPQYSAADFPLDNTDLGVDHLIHPEEETASAVVQLLHQSSATYAVEFEGGKIQLLGLRLDRNSELLNMSLTDLGRKYESSKIQIVAINRSHKTIIPKGDNRLLSGDQIFVVCDPGYTSDLMSLAGKPETPMSDIMVLGGGLIGQTIASSMAHEARIKIVEGREEQAWKIADALPDTLVIHGDGTDFDLLTTEGLGEMDAFVAVTGDDEKNIITTLLARHTNVPRAIALVNKVEYLPVMSSIGLDTVVSKQLLTVNAVQRFIQHQQVASIASLPGINAQFIEYIAEAGCRMTKQPLRKIRFPDHAIVGAILHDEQVEIPTGESRIRPGDKIVVFSLPQAVDELDRLFEC